MCKAAHEPGGPQRCSGDARRNYERSQTAMERIEEWAEELERHMKGQARPWGPYIGPPPFAPPFARPFDEWYDQALQRNPELDRVTGYGIYYNLAAHQQQPWKAQGYTTARPSCPSPDSDPAEQRRAEWQDRLSRYEAGEHVPWGPHIGPPPFAPPFAPPFEQWYPEAVKNGEISPTLSLEDAYADYYNLAGSPEDWAANGYSGARPDQPASRDASNNSTAQLHASLRGAAARFLSEEELAELDAEVAAATSGTDF